MNRLDYPGKPIYLGTVKSCLKKNTLIFAKNIDSEDGKYVSAQIKLPGGQKINIPPKRQYQIADEAINGLLLDLAPGTELAEKFRKQLKHEYDQVLENTPISQKLSFGELWYYPRTDELATYLDSEWQRTALITRNSLLIRDPLQQISLSEQREKFSKVVIGSAGASVGKNAWAFTIDTLNPDCAKIADPKTYKVSNARRTQLNMRQIGINKAVAAALQAHEIDPYLKAYVYSEGINDENVEQFLNGNPKTNEPAVDFIIEETDDPFAKVKLRQYARTHRKILLMITDIGIAYQIDIRNWRDYPNLPLTSWSTDQEILAAQSRALSAKSREAFLGFAWSLIGPNWKQVPEFRDLITEEIDSEFTGGVPQMGIAAYAGGADVALNIALITLGYKRRESVFVDNRTRKYILSGSEY